MNKGDSMLEEMSNISRDIEILRMNQKEILEVNNTVKMKTNFNRFISRLDMTEEGISVLAGISVGSSRTEKKKKKPQNITAKDCGTTAKVEERKE